MEKTICFVAGHSGGHILPSLTHAQKLLDEDNTTNILFFSTNAKLDKTIVSRHSIVSQHITLNITGVPYLKKILFPLFALKCFGAFFQSLYHLSKQRPKSIISMGGIISIPVCLAGWLLRIPIELYELNVEPGKAITFLAGLAQKIYVIHPETAAFLPAKKCDITSYPIRFSSKTPTVNRTEILKSLRLSPSAKTIFVLGGSQGSLFLNRLIKMWINAKENLSSFQIIHQTGERDATDWKKFYEHNKIPAIIFSYHEHLELFYQAADLVISRAGAGTLAELNFFKKKSLIIPLETASTKHQTYNALAYSRKNPELFYVIAQKSDYQDAIQKINQLIELD